MRDKLISAVIGILLGALGSYIYFTLYNTGETNTNGSNIEKNISGEVSDEQMQRIVEKTGIAEDVIQSRLDSGESMRDIMGATSGGAGGTGDGKGRKPE